jgi:hypothetical protein
MTNQGFTVTSASFLPARSGIPMRRVDRESAVSFQSRI